MKRLQAKVLLLVAVLCAAAPAVKRPSSWVGPVVWEATASMNKVGTTPGGGASALEVDDALDAEDGVENTMGGAEEGDQGSLTSRSRGSRVRRGIQGYLSKSSAPVAVLGVGAILALLAGLATHLKWSPVATSTIPKQKLLQINWLHEVLVPLGVLSAFAVILTLMTVGSLSYLHS